MITYHATVKSDQLSLMQANTKNEFTYQNDKLGIKDGLSGTNDFRIHQSFSWIQQANHLLYKA
jgi:hypothetical protein